MLLQRALYFFPAFQLCLLQQRVQELAKQLDWGCWPERAEGKKQGEDVRETIMPTVMVALLRHEFVQDVGKIRKAEQNQRPKRWLGRSLVVLLEEHILLTVPGAFQEIDMFCARLSNASQISEASTDVPSDKSPGEAFPAVM
eukprot:s574_g14.t1